MIVVNNQFQEAVFEYCKHFHLCELPRGTESPPALTEPED